MNKHTSLKDKPRLPFSPITSRRKNDIGVPGVQVEMSVEAAEMGAFVENALSEQDDWESQGVPTRNDPDMPEKASDQKEGSEIDQVATGISAAQRRPVRRRTKTERLERFLKNAWAIQSANTQEREALRFTARVLVQATFPHSQVEGNEWSRSNGALSVHMLAPSTVGLPYGSYPRLLMTWITTEAVSNKQRKSGDGMRRLELGHSLSGFMGELGLIPTGGRWGTIKRLREQMERLMNTAIFAVDLTDDTATGLRRRTGYNLMVADNSELWWDPKKPDQGILWGSWVELSQSFFDFITERPVPVDMDVLRLIKKSPLALDVYCWVTYRVSYLSRSAVIPWQGLKRQLGVGYPDTPQGLRNFKKKFIVALKKVHLAWPELHMEITDNGLRLRPCAPHVRRKLGSPSPKRLK